MFTDIVGYTALMSKDEAKALQLLQHNRELLKPIIRQFRGEWLKEIGDGTLSSFDSAVDSVNCALAIQQVLKDDPDLKLRIGIHIGDVVFERGDVFGDGVNIASRLEPLADPGGIYISEKVQDDIRNKSGIVTEFVGERSLKGVDQPLKVYTVTVGKAPPIKPISSVLAAVGRRRWMGAALMAVAAVVVVLVTYMTGILGGNGADFAPRLGDRSVAVLPFLNLSDSQEDEYFSDGVMDDILTHLARIGDLRVIARTSVMQYKGTEKRIRDIARELGVATILEGSVRRSANRVRITGQLIDAETEEHLWAESYDRDLTDIFAIQSEVAQKIAAALKATLSPEAKERIEKRPTENTEAYEWYLRGNDYLHQGSIGVAGSRSDLDKALSVYQRAIELDPNFAAAYARLSYTYTALHFFHSMLPHGERALQAVERALELDPDLPEGHLALGYYYNLVNRDYDQALKAFATAQKGLQSDSDLLSEIGFVQMRQGKWDQALSNLRLAADRDPRSPLIHKRLANIYLYRRQYSKAEQVLNHLMALTPDNPWVYAHLVEIALLRDGDVKRARQVVKEASNYLQPVDVMWAGSELIHRLGFWRFGLLGRDFNTILRDYSDTRRKAGNQIYYFSMAQLHGLAEQPELSRAYYDSSLAWIEAGVAAAPGKFQLQSDLGLACAFLGLKDRAIAAGLRSKELMPISTCHW
ncbi:MAG: tetratricopeptide repeat protein, partial [Candidatus Marinimicrobia bacterium]|nr:tetratricopeptide repeat protein [Candidatus Neomarinimicrobiota bacterium]